jgi:hypothetical protein
MGKKLSGRSHALACADLQQGGQATWLLINLGRVGAGPLALPEAHTGGCWANWRRAALS